MEFNDENTKLIEIVRNPPGDPLLSVISICKYSKNLIVHISQDGFKTKVNVGIHNGTEGTVILLEPISRDKNSRSDMSRDCCRMHEISRFLHQDIR